MEIKTFKKIVGNVFLAKQFFKKGSYWYRDGEECICIIGIQKSNYSNGYYINLGFVLKGLNVVSDKLRDVDGDIRARLTSVRDGKKSDFFDLEKLADSDEHAIIEGLQREIDDIVDVALRPNGIKTLLSQRPNLLYQTKLAAKHFLGIENSP